MDFLFSRNVIAVLQIICAVALTGLVLIQQKGVGLSSTFGGDGGFYRSKRGMEKVISNATMVSAILFVGLSFVFLYVA